MEYCLNGSSSIATFDKRFWHNFKRVWHAGDYCLLSRDKHLYTELGNWRYLTRYKIDVPTSAADSTTGTARRVHSANQAKYFILKSSNETNIETSAAHGIWCCGETPNSRLSNAYNSTSGPVFLIFSVNKRSAITLFSIFSFMR